MPTTLRIAGATPSTPVPVLFTVDLTTHLRTAPTTTALQSMLLSESVLCVLGWQQGEQGDNGLQVRQL